MISLETLQWEKAAFEKLASLGAVVFLPTEDGKYLMQVSDGNDESEKGKLRPPGGGKNPSDRNLLKTIVREIREEFDIPESETRKKIKFLGFEYRDKYFGNAVFELKNHGLGPGEYQASNSKDEKITLVEVRLGDPDYVGPDPDLLLTEEEKKDAEETDAETKAASSWDIYKEASDEDLHELFKPDFTPDEMEEYARSRHRLYHRMAPRLASMERWPKEWTTSEDPNGWIEWYEQYHSGRRSNNDNRQIRRWLNFKARHGASFKANPTPRRGWALVNWAIDPEKLLPAEKRPAARAAMAEYQQKVDLRYAHDKTRKAAAATGLERPVANYRFITEDELLSIGEGRLDPLTLGPLQVVSPDGERTDLLDYVNKEASEHSFHGTTHHSRCGHSTGCRCKRPPGEKPPERTVDDICFSCKMDLRRKEAKAEQGIMSGQSIDSSAPVLVPPPPAAQESDVEPLASDQEIGIAMPKKLDWGDRLRRLRERRGENPDGSVNQDLLNQDYFTAESLKNASLFTVAECRDRCRQECIKKTGNNNPTPEQVEAWAHEELDRIYEDQEKAAGKKSIHERVVASAKEGVCPKCAASEHMETAITAEGKIRCGNCHEVTPHTYWGVSKVASFPKGARFYQPENFDTIKDLSTKDFRVSAGGNDWESTWTGVTFTFGGDSNYGRKSRVWGSLAPPERLTDVDSSNVSKEEQDWGRRAVKKWIAAADAQRKVINEETGAKFSWSPEDFMAAAKNPEIAALLDEHGQDVMAWDTVKAAAGIDQPGEILDRHKSTNPEPSLGQSVAIPDPRIPKKLPLGYVATADQAKPASAMSDGGPALDIPASSTPATHVKTPMAESQPIHPVGTPMTPHIAAPSAPAPPVAAPQASPYEFKLPSSINQELQAEFSPTLAGKGQPMGSGPTIADTAIPSGQRIPALSQGLGSIPMGVLGQQHPVLAAQRAAEVPAMQKTAMAIDSSGIPTTGPESILYALQNLDLDKKEQEAKSVIQRKLKSKRPDAVKILNYIKGMRDMGIKPHELMVNRVPVIPPQFRPYTFTGDTFVPGHANELYRDLINLVGKHGELEQKLGKVGSGFNRLNIYDAVRAVYGFGEPTSPKTRARDVSGFLTKVVGAGPKMSYPQHRMLAKDMDFTGNSVIGVDPDLGLDEIGIPDEMAWKLYAPYVQRRLVRAGMSPEQAVRHIVDRHELASKHLDLEMRERPVVYGRQPSWHKYNVVGGWPKRIQGNMIRINPLVTTGMNADFDGDTLNVHLPSLPESVKDAREKLMASKQLFSMKNRTRVMPLPKQEFVLGLYNAQRRPSRKLRQFRDEASALRAIRRGDISLSDEIQIGSAKPQPLPPPSPVPSGTTVLGEPTHLGTPAEEASDEHETAEALSELKS